MMQSISSYINPNTRALTSNYKNTVIKDKEAYNGAMLQHLLNPVEDLAQALKTPIKLAKGASISRQNNSVNIAEGQSIRVNGGHVLTVHTAEPVLKIVPVAVSALPGVSSPARLIFPALCKPVRVTAVHPGEHKIYFFHSYSPAL